MQKHDLHGVRLTTGTRYHFDTDKAGVALVAVKVPLGADVTNIIGVVCNTSGSGMDDSMV